MSVKTLLSAAAAAALLSATPALAQTSLDPAGPTIGTLGSGGLDPMLMQQRIDDLDDADVYDVNGKEIGEIEEIVRRNGEIYAVFDADEFLDTNNRDFVIPLNQFRYADQRLTLPVTEQQVDALQEFRRGDFEEFAEERGLTVGDLYGAR